MAQTTTTTLATTIPAEFILGEVMDAAYPNNIIVPLMWRGVLPPGQGKTMNIQKLPSVSAASVAEASDITAAARTTTEATITVGEVGTNTELTKLAQTTSRLNDQLPLWAREQGKAIAQKVTGDAAALFSALNGGSAVGSTGTDITVANFLEAMYTLDNANAPGEKRCVLHPRQVYDLFLAVSASTGTPFSNVAELVREGRLPGGTPSAGFMGSLFNVPIYQTTEVDTANSGADRCGAMFVPEAMGYVELYPLTVGYDGDASKRASEVVVTICYGVGELNDTYGVSIVMDA